MLTKRQPSQNSRQRDASTLFLSSPVIPTSSHPLNLNPSSFPIPQMLTLTGGLVIRSELLVPLFDITQDHSPFLFGRFSGNDDLVAVLPSVVTVEEFEEPRVSVVGLFKRGLESEV